MSISLKGKAAGSKNHNFGNFGELNAFYGKTFRNMIL